LGWEVAWVIGVWRLVVIIVEDKGILLKYSMKKVELLRGELLTKVQNEK
jgi:hypothetical protein